MTKNSNSGVSRRDEIINKVLKAVDPDMTSGDFHLLLRSYSLGASENETFDALDRPFCTLRDCLYTAVQNLADADAADNRRVEQSHPAFLSREQRLAMARLATLVACDKLATAYSRIHPVLNRARSTVRGRVMPQSISTAVVLTKLQAVETLIKAVRVFIAFKWKNMLNGKSETEINAILHPIHYQYQPLSLNRPAIYMKEAGGEVQVVNLADLAKGFRTESGHFVVRRKIESFTPSFYDDDWAITAYPAEGELIYSADDFIVTNGSLNLDRHHSAQGAECNEQIAQEHNHKHESMPYREWKRFQALQAN